MIQQIGGLTEEEHFGKSIVIVKQNFALMKLLKKPIQRWIR